MKSPDVLVVGSGIAGLVFAIRAAEWGRVLLVTKRERPESSTNYAQGGVAAVFGEDDSFHLHVRDTVIAGAGLCHRDAVSVLVEEGPGRVRELLEVGVRFTREAGEFSLGHEGGHSRRRIVRADDLTGREIERALIAAALQSPNIEIIEDHLVTDLIIGSDPSTGTARCHGALVLGPDAAEAAPVYAKSVVLATGGCGQVYRHTTNPAIATGDGVAMAYRAGAMIANMEFIQFHPTALYPARGNTLLISEAVRGEGAVLIRPDGTPFMREYHRLMDLAPRDVVARAIDQEILQLGCEHMLLDCSLIPAREIRSRFPNLVRETAARGFDMLREPLPIVPAAHYMCGGVLTDIDGRTTVPGLFAVGETACTGVHGANRLASNSLLEALVFAHRAAESLGPELESIPRQEPDVELRSSRAEPLLGTRSALSREEVQVAMWELVGIVRSDERLAGAAERLREMQRRMDDLWAQTGPTVETVELRNLVQTAALIVESAQQRRESRGLHFTLDHPYRDNERYLKDTILRRTTPSEA